MTDLADVECQAPQGCLAYGIYFYREPSEYIATSGEHSDLVREVVPSDRDGLELAWAFSEELCAQDVCSYCRMWSTSDERRESARVPGRLFRPTPESVLRRYRKGPSQGNDATEGADVLEREVRRQSCPGVWEHAKHALARNQNKFPWCDMEIGVFLVPFDLSLAGVFEEVLRQIRAGVTYAVAS